MGKNVDLIVCLAHARIPNTEKMAMEIPGVDIVLGGHEHAVFEKKFGNDSWAVISGSDFRNIGVIDVTLRKNTDEPHEMAVTIKDITSEIEEDVKMAALIDEIDSAAGKKLKKRLGFNSVALDATAKSCRNGESNLGNFLCDTIKTVLGVDVALLNGGTIRSDTIYPPGPFTMRHMTTILPFVDPIVVICITGQQLLDALEAG